MDSFTPSTVPGCRTPHVWLDDDRSLYDAMGSGYTLIRTETNADVSGLVAAATRVGVPLSVLDLSNTEAGTAYDRALVLSRPDQHVAWRGNAVPPDPGWLIDRIRGAGAPEQPTGSVTE
jgi:hypothetical protein